jgi:hypothetical protein
MRKARAQFLQRLLLIAAAGLGLTAPALINGGPFFSTDSIAYIRGPDQAIVKLLGPAHATVWSAKPLGVGFHDGIPAQTPKDEDRSPPMAGRSIYYGLLANLGARAGGFWLTVAAQALAAAFALQLLCRALGWRRDRSYLIVAAIAAFATPLGFFASCVMPDVWAPILILVAAALVAGGERLTRAELTIGFLLMAFAATAHTTHILLLAAVSGASLILMILRNLPRFRLGAPGLASALALAALVAGMASGAVFNLAVVKVYHKPPVQPPFLTARLVGDGRPGDPWLRRHCPGAGFQACAYVNRLPMPTDDFLWSTARDKSAFWTASPSERTKLGDEQFRFAAAVFHDNPLAVMGQVASDGVTQFADMSLEDFNHKDSVRASLDEWMVGPDAKVWRASMAYHKVWPVRLLNGIELGAFVLGLAGVAALCVRARTPVRFRPEDERIRVLLAGFLIIATVTANAAVCGGLSDIFGRYQARVTAPLILIGLIALSRLGSGAPRSR